MKKILVVVFVIIALSALVLASITCISRFKAEAAQTRAIEAEKALYEQQEKEDYNNILRISKEHLEFCHTTNNLGKRYDDSVAAKAKAQEIIDKYPNGFTGEWYDMAKASTLDIAVLSLDYIF